MPAAISLPTTPLIDDWLDGDLLALIEAVPLPVLVLDWGGQPLAHNRPCRERLGRPANQSDSHGTVGSSNADHHSDPPAVHPDDRRSAGLAVERARLAGRTEVDLRLDDGKGSWVGLRWIVRAHPVRPGALAFAAADVDDRERLQALRDRARLDPLTGLLGRAGVTEAIDAAVGRGGGRGTTVALFDIDRFKSVNDSLGHHVGDELLRLVAARLRHALPTGISTGRLGGDEFVVVATPGADLDGAELGQRIASVFDQPYALDGRVYQVTASIGAVTAIGGESTSELLRQADVAAYEAKRRGRNQLCVADPVLRAAHRHELEIGDELAASLGTGRFEPYLQAIVDPRSGEVAAHESLLRWHHNGAVVAADLVVDIATEAGILAAISTEVRQATLAIAADHRSRVFTVNLSAQELLDHNLPATLAADRARYGVRPQHLVVEVSELTLATHGDRVAPVLGRLAAAGHPVAIDDFGAGPLCLGHLCDLEPAWVKLDRSRLAAARQAPRARAALASVVAVASDLGIISVIEGVGEQADNELAVEVGADLVQGFHHHRPATAPDALGIS